MESISQNNLAFNIFLYWFIDVKKIDPDFSQKFVHSLKSYSLDEKKMIEEALIWGKDLRDLTCNFPLAEDIYLSNEDIRKELLKVIEILQLK